MSNLSNTTGEGGGAGRAPGRFTDTGYGTHDGQGNVETGAQYEKGTGYDEHGQVHTRFGQWPVSYDPVSGMAIDNTTTGYDFPAAGGPAGGLLAADVGGLVDVSAEAPGHAANATPELQQQLQAFFAASEQQQPPAAGSGGDQGALPSAGEETGQGVAERLDAGQYLPGQPEVSGEEAEGWRDRR